MGLSWKSVVDPLGFSSGGGSDLVPFLGAGVGAVLGGPVGAAVGYAAGSSFSSARAAREANATNVALQRESQAWQLNLANTAHQREVKDLVAAGLNPILASHGGAAVPAVPPARVESLAPVYNNAASQVLAAKNLQADLAVKRSQVQANSAVAISNAEDARRKAMENDVIELAKENEAYVLRRRGQNKTWLGWFDDVKQGIDLINPFSSVHAGQNNSVLGRR